ncbi:hypothetical protein Micbo1qcDRAFT_235454 [Microdochium bolleyi]|uniref:Mitochondrial intermembrane space import and assembly protein 40 n=1 Tax=Microdochium bolleyi TaxID=196109 RepID=A0A136IW33_9PEZI|nr:hypothetical protein Micbo1qcDRAFT_235454 [Microdochium bolleyi]
MYRSALRATPRIPHAVRSSTLRSAAPRRFASTVPADKSRSWKSSAARWGLAIGALYYYNTSTAFAEEPQSSTIPVPAHFSDDDMPTVDAIVAQKRKEAEARQLKAASDATAKSSAPATTQATHDESAAAAPPSSSSPPPAAGSPEALEAEANQQGAFNPETGEINWDCPCLGGMADGPCGEDFKAAFSCFVYSTEEPKGMDCIDKFQAMQDCFRLHPEIYGEELADAEDAGEDAPSSEEPAELDAAKPSPKAADVSARTANGDSNTKDAANTPADDPAPSATKPAGKPTEKASKKPAEKAAEKAAEPVLTPAQTPTGSLAQESDEAKRDPRFDATSAPAK